MLLLLAIPLGAAFLVSVYIAHRTDENVHRKAVFAAIVAIVIGFILFYPSPIQGWLDSQFTNAPNLAMETSQFSDFVGYVFGTGWLSLVWVTGIVVELVVDFTGTRIWESDVITWALRILAIIGVGALLYSFLTGHPIKLLG